jgi:hypothetical protein
MVLTKEAFEIVKWPLRRERHRDIKNRQVTVWTFNPAV